MLGLYCVHFSGSIITIFWIVDQAQSLSGSNKAPIWLEQLVSPCWERPGRRCGTGAPSMAAIRPLGGSGVGGGGVSLSSG